MKSLSLSISLRYIYDLNLVSKLINASLLESPCFIVIVCSHVDNFNTRCKTSQTGLSVN